MEIDDNFRVLKVEKHSLAANQEIKEGMVLKGFQDICAQQRRMRTLFEDTSVSLMRGCSVPSTICGHDVPPTAAGKSLCQIRSFCFCLSQPIILTVFGLRSVRGSFTLFGDECGQEVRAAVVVHLPRTSLLALRSAPSRHCRRCSASLSSSVRRFRSTCR